MSNWLVEFPLWGLQVPELTPGIDNLISISGGFVYQPTWVEWEQSEKTDVVQENAGYLVGLERLGQSVEVLPPPCFGLHAVIEPYPDLNSGDDYMIIALAFASALRLHKRGQFIDFTQSGIYGVTEGGMVARSVTPLRSAYYRYPWSDRYQLFLKELGQLEELCDVLRQIHDTGFGLVLENLSGPPRNYIDVI